MWQDDKAKVEGLFLGGEPFLVQCASPVDQLHRTFLDAAADLSGAGVTPAVIDCDGKLPSGKTVKAHLFQKFSMYWLAYGKYTRSLTFENLCQERFFKDRALEEPVFFVVCYVCIHT